MEMHPELKRKRNFHFDQLLYIIVLSYCVHFFILACLQVLFTLIPSPSHISQPMLLYILCLCVSVSVSMSLPPQALFNPLSPSIHLPLFATSTVVSTLYDPFGEVINDTAFLLLVFSMRQKRDRKDTATCVRCDERKRFTWKEARKKGDEAKRRVDDGKESKKVLVHLELSRLMPSLRFPFRVLPLRVSRSLGPDLGDFQKSSTLQQ